MHTYRESVYLGDARLKPPQVKAILATMTPNWYGPTYDLIRKNCCSFSDAFAVELGVGRIPSWVKRLADAGAALGILKEKVEDDADLDDVLFEHICAVRLQRKFRRRKQAKQEAIVAERERAKQERELREAARQAI